MRRTVELVSRLSGLLQAKRQQPTRDRQEHGFEAESVNEVFGQRRKKHRASHAQA
jgi:hypothetical protein